MGTLARTIFAIGIALGGVRVGASGSTTAGLANRTLSENQRRMTNEDRLAKCDAGFAAKVRAVIDDLESSGFKPWVAESWRSPKHQVQAFTLGHSQVKFGFHNVVGSRREPRAFAVDLIDTPGANAPSQAYALRLSSVAHHYNLNTGILWGLSHQQRRVVAKAIEALHAYRSVKIGWDPCHLEPADRSLSQILRDVSRLGG
jgi:hypothetical protein